MTAHNHRLLDYLNTRPEISPWRATLRDSAVLYGVVAMAQTTAMAASGYFDHSSVLSSESNFLRIAQGIGAFTNVSLTALMSGIGRYQTYCDLRDLQSGIPADQVASRARIKSGLAKSFDWMLKNTFNINAYASLPLCAVMAASGVTSGRWGEAISAAFLAGTYLVQARPERYAINNATGSTTDIEMPTKGSLAALFAPVARAWDYAKTHTPLNVIADKPPMIISSALACWRLGPLFLNAAVKGDGFQMAQAALGVPMYAMKANTTKDGIGRGGRSIADPDYLEAAEVARILLEGRISFRSWFKRQPVSTSPG